MIGSLLRMRICLTSLLLLGGDVYIPTVISGSCFFSRVDFAKVAVFSYEEYDER